LNLKGKNMEKSEQSNSIWLSSVVSDGWPELFYFFFCARITIIFVRSSIIINQHNIGHKVFFNSVVYVRIFRIHNFEVKGFHSSCKFQISQLALF